MESRPDGKTPRVRDILRDEDIVRYSLETRRAEDKEPWCNIWKKHRSTLRVKRLKRLTLSTSGRQTRYAHLLTTLTLKVLILMQKLAQRLLASEITARS